MCCYHKKTSRIKRRRRKKIEHHREKQTALSAALIKICFFFFVVSFSSALHCLFAVAAMWFWYDFISLFAVSCVEVAVFEINKKFCSFDNQYESKKKFLPATPQTTHKFLKLFLLYFGSVCLKSYFWFRLKYLKASKKQLSNWKIYWKACCHRVFVLNLQLFLCILEHLCNVSIYS